MISYPTPHHFMNLVKKKRTVYRDKSRKIAYVTLHDNEEWSPRWGFYDEDDEYRRHYGIPIPEEEADDSGNDNEGTAEAASS